MSVSKTINRVNSNTNYNKNFQETLLTLVNSYYKKITFFIYFLLYIFILHSSFHSVSQRQITLFTIISKHYSYIQLKTFNIRIKV